MNEGTSTEIFNQEIAELEAKLAAKKQELVRAGIEQPEKHLFKEVVRDHAFSGEQTPRSSGAVTPASSSVASTTVDSQTQITLDALIAEAFTSGITTAVSKARKLESPYLLELLHDRLVDAYYEKLIQSRQIKAI